MNDRDGDALVLVDAEGNYYVLPYELIEVSRIEPEARERVDGYLAERDDADAGRFSFAGTIALPDESRWTHFTPSVAWPNVQQPGDPGRHYPSQMVMVDKPVIAPPEAS